MNGWPAAVSDQLYRPYTARRNELSVQDGFVMWGSRIVIPAKGHAPVMDQLHEGHPGVSRMKALARSYMWWPGMDSDLENKVKSCGECQQHRNVPADAPLQPWDWPEKPWSRLHMDYAGPFLGKMFFLLIDAHSKWLEIHIVSTANSTLTIQTLQHIFSTHGLPEMLVSDNATCFTITERHRTCKNLAVSSSIERVS